MKYYSLEIKNFKEENGEFVESGTELVKLRLTGEACIELEEKSKMSLMQYISQGSVTVMINLLMYMRRFEVPNFCKKDATDLFNKLLDNGYGYKEILDDVIYEALVVSGFFKKEEEVK